MVENKNNIDNVSIKKFLEGRCPMGHIVNMEYRYSDNYMTVIYRDSYGVKRKLKDPFRPFVWASREACVNMCGGDRKMVKQLLKEYGIGIKVLKTTSDDGTECPNIDKGYIFMFYAIQPMPYNTFINFFKKTGVPIFGDKKSADYESYRNKRLYVNVSPQEQHMIATGKRFFKGYDDYDNIIRMIFDLETSGLDPYVNSIEQIGIRTNKGFEKIISISGETEEEKKKNELKAIEMMLAIIKKIDPDVITAHNGENFDWNFIIVRCEVLGYPIKEMSEKYFPNHPIYKRSDETVLKLGGEVEYYHPTVIYGINVTDSLHAVRRAQAIDSNMQRADLKYVTKYSKMNKPDRVYVPGDRISEIWNDNNENYCLNTTNGKWYEITDQKPAKEGDEYSIVTGRYIVERYLLDDLWECDKVELRYNQPNFLLCKSLPIPFSRCCTMGTAAQWKLLMLAWSYEHDLAIPPFGKQERFTGGLSRLLKTGYVNNVVKLDYNSLYPSIILTWKISSPQDLQKVLLRLLEFFLTEREKYKGLKKDAAKRKNKANTQIEELGDINNKKYNELLEEFRKWAEEESSNDKKQLPLKIFANSYFGSTGNPSLFPFSSLVAAEKTTCIGRQCLRLMISWFNNLGYEPIVGDSFTGDTPLFVKEKATNMLDIKPISEIVNESSIEVDALGREYDYSDKPYLVLCRSGWCDVNYVYRHKTNKPLYEVKDDKSSICVTEDHSLFNDQQEKINPNNIKAETKLEYYNGVIKGDVEVNCTDYRKRVIRDGFKNNKFDRVPKFVLNGDEELKIYFLVQFAKFKQKCTNKTYLAGVKYLHNCVSAYLSYNV